MIASQITAGVELSLRIGQRVRHLDYQGRRVTGVVRSLAIDAERGLMVEIVLDAPIVIKAGEGRPLDIWHQHAPAHEFAPFDDREEVIEGLLASLEEARTGLLWYRDRFPEASDGSDDEAMARIDSAIARATGDAS